MAVEPHAWAIVARNNDEGVVREPEAIERIEDSSYRPIDHSHHVAAVALFRVPAQEVRRQPRRMRG